MIRSWRDAATQFWGRGRGGRGRARSLAQRSRRRLQFAERQTLDAIVDRNFSGFVLPHQHATLRRRPVLTLPFQLQQPALVTHHPVFTHHSFLLQPEHFVQLPISALSPWADCCLPRHPPVTPTLHSHIPLLPLPSYLL